MMSPVVLMHRFHSTFTPGSHGILEVIVSVVLAAVAGLFVGSQATSLVLVTAATCVLVSVGLPVAIKWERTVLVSFALLFVVVWEPAPFDVLTLLMLAWWITFGERTEVTSTRRRFLILVVAFNTFQIITIALSEIPVESARYAAITLLVSLMAVLGEMMAADLRLLRLALLGYLIGAATSTVVALAGFWGLIPLKMVVWGGGGRLKGFFKDPNVLSPYLVLALLIVLASYQYRDLLWPQMLRLRAALVVVFAAGILLAYSRGGWLNAGIAITAFVTLSAVNRPRFAIRAALLSPVVAIAFWLIWARLISTLPMLQDRLALQTYDAGRFSNQAQLLHEVVMSPVFGHGPASDGAFHGVAAHNLFIKVPFEYGFFGTIVFFALIVGAVWWPIRGSFRCSSTETRILSAVIASAMIGLIANSLVIDSLHWRHLWILVGFGWGTAAWQSAHAHRRPVTRWATNASGRLNRRRW